MPSPIPRPAHLVSGDGFFQLSAQTPLLWNSPLADNGVVWFQKAFYDLSGSALSGRILQRAKNAQNGAIRLEIEENRPAESYHLEIAPDGVEIRAGDASGFLYGLVSLLQLVPFEAPERPGLWVLPALKIEDAPRFEWRGMMLDSARHFQPVAWIKRFLDLLALFKFNVFHWHLTDDQGWRVEIKKYPELTGVCAWRTESRVGHENGATQTEKDGRPHGGFYSQSEIREVVAYAEARGIRVVPEIEMPGHTQAVFAAFPALSCSGEKMDVSTRWSIHDAVFCAGNDAVFRFLEDVLEEVLALFPSQWIHIGGDECPKKSWKSCPKCQKRLLDENLKDERELQAWFVRHFDDFLRERGRRLMGWDEILEGGLTQNSAVMSWRGESGGIVAARAGHQVVMAPQSFVYLDYYQSANVHQEPLAIGGLVTLRHIYGWEPIPDELKDEEAQHILGGQGALWTEYLPRPDAVEYMAFPRACGLAEVLWSAPQTRDYADFCERLAPVLRLLDRWGVNYHPPTSRDFEEAEMRWP